MDIFEQMKDDLATAEVEYSKFMERGVVAAAARARLALQGLRKASQELRVEVQEKKKSILAAKKEAKAGKAPAKVAKKKPAKEVPAKGKKKK